MINKTNSYSYDHPEIDLKNDLLGYKNYVEELSELIIQTFNAKENLNIGVVGAWGDGKTTAINMCLTELKKHFIWYKKLNWLFFIPTVILFLFGLWSCYSSFVNMLNLITSSSLVQTIFQYVLKYCLVLIFLVVLLYKQIFDMTKQLWSIITRTFCSLFCSEDYVEICFSPWSCKDDKQLMQEYLKAIAKSFGIDFGFLSGLLLKYAKLIVGKDINWLSNILNPSTNLSDLKNQIIEKLKLSNKRIIVIIDDLDRIQCEEIYNVLKLIGTVANFPKVINILSYDKNYIIKELNKCINSNSKTEFKKEIVKEETKECIHETKIDVEEDKASKYIEKIVDIENPLPKIEDKDLKDFFFKELDDIVKDEK